jgi:hypothetical protein
VLFDNAENHVYAARSDFYTVAALDGESYSDPGVANVKTGTGYNYAGAAQVGTYDGSDRWSDPGVANVRNGNAYKANSTSNNRTGSLVAPSLANTKIGVAGDGGTGTYDGSDRWSDPGIHNVATGIQYQVNGATVTGDSDEPAPADVKKDVVYDNGTKTGLYTGADRWSDPGEANVNEGVTYLANAVQKTGTLKLVTNTIAEMVLEGIDTGLKVTEGDALTLALRAKTGSSSYLDLTAAVFETKLVGKTGIKTIGDSSHVKAADQVANPGRFTLALTAAETADLKLGARKEIITKVTQGSSVLHFHGVIEILDDQPQG